MTLGTILLLLLLGAILSAVIQKAPEDWIPAPWKRTMIYAIVVVVVIVIVGGLLGGWGQLTNQRVGR